MHAREYLLKHCQQNGPEEYLRNFESQKINMGRHTAEVTILLTVAQRKREQQNTTMWRIPTTSIQEQTRRLKAVFVVFQ